VVRQGKNKGGITRVEGAPMGPTSKNNVLYSRGGKKGLEDGDQSTTRRIILLSIDPAWTRIQKKAVTSEGSQRSSRF